MYYNILFQLLKMSNAFENDLDDKVSDLRIERTRTDTLLYSKSLNGSHLYLYAEK